MRIAIYVGALALTLGGGLPVVALTPVNAAPRVGDCEGGGLLGGLTGGLCKTVEAVGDTVNGIAGTPPPSTGPDYGHTTETTMNDEKDRKDKKGGKSEKHEKSGKGSSGADGLSGTGYLGQENGLEGPLGLTAPTLTPEISAAPAAEEDEGVDLLPKDLDSVCPPMTGSPECASSTAISTPEETVSPSAAPRPSPSHKDRPEFRGDHETAPLPKEPLRPVETRRHAADRDRDRGRHGRQEGDTPSDPVPVIDAEAPRLELLWPTGPVMRKFQRTVTPTRSPDPLGTALTAALLVAAILAVRLLYARRIGEESMPLEPLRMRRQRTA
ncbi:hypothetical protein [Streptosporangium carneum]|uniref:Uncharacterized protein n=1 Tax=Streptosporangium carneum TaxID=47481 RepID=A0A9W6I1E5_9ACTN|nr:hypothetical protein [Streptosporangium carneum]GLK09907.1 hypothetical protein GCM10017600_33130 [Streptosporangium carneum]